MARIRTIKPEFYSSPGIDETSPWARLLYIAMWNWADDTGRGKAEARELMGFAFPLDEGMTVGEFRRLLGEVRRVFGVNFYKVDGRPYYSIPSWEKHQKIDKRSQSRWPTPEEGEAYDPDTNMPSDLQEQSNSWVLGGHSADIRRTPGAGTGEQGNSGTGEQRNRSSSSATPPREDVESICGRLHDRIVANGSRATIGDSWRNEARLLIDRDDRDIDEVLELIDWCQADDFWKSNILSMSKFRQQYDKLRLRRESERPSVRPGALLNGISRQDAKVNGYLAYANLDHQKEIS